MFWLRNLADRNAVQYRVPQSVLKEICLVNTRQNHTSYSMFWLQVSWCSMWLHQSQLLRLAQDNRGTWSHWAFQIPVEIPTLPREPGGGAWTCADRVPLVSWCGVSNHRSPGALCRDWQHSCQKSSLSTGRPWAQSPVNQSKSFQDFGLELILIS